MTKVAAILINDSGGVELAKTEEEVCESDAMEVKHAMLFNALFNPQGHADQTTFSDTTEETEDEQ